MQFATGEDGGLIFDLPTEALTPQEQSRAIAVLKLLEISLEEWDVYDKPDGRVVGKRAGFQKNVGNDPLVAAGIAWAVFVDVYGLSPSFELGVEES